MNKTSPRRTQSNFRRSPWLPRFALLAGAVLGLVAARPAGAQSALPFYEPFPGTYVNGEYLGSTNGVSGSTSGGTSGAIWNIGNSLSSSCARVQTTAALHYPGLTNIDATAQSDGLASYPKDTSSTKDRAAALTIPASTTLYASCLVDFLAITNTGTASFFGLSTTATSGSSASHSGAVIYVNPLGQLQVAKNNASTPATNTTYNLTTNTTYLLVLRYKFNGTNGPDQVDLWVNPTALGGTNIPTPTITTTNNANITSFGSVAYFQAVLPTAFYLDEIRVATNWSGVTPTNAPAGNLYAVTGGGSGCPGDSFAVGVSGSDAGVSYMLFTNGVFTGQNVNGTGAAVSFGSQSVNALYTVLATNNTTANVSWISGSTTVSVVSALNIAAQPVSAVVATNALAAFTVSSPGFGLNYQWYRNGTALTDGGHVSGSQTTNLVISPVTTADVATTLSGYYVIITNRCGNLVKSVTNALALDPAASLTWYGDGVSNLWDVATSANFNSNTALFNYGDNVTFDDTSLYTNAVLASQNISPGSITINGTQNFLISGSGSLAGPGSITMNSAGFLTLSAQNNETGGLVVSNGTVYFSSLAALGSGPINLAGGGLSSPNAGLVSIGNSITVTGTNSLIGINSSGGQPLVLSSPINGLGGTLTFQNNSTKSASPTIQLTSTNFTFNLPVTLNVGGVSGGGLYVSGNNTSGTQTWNGQISGNGSLQRNGSGGTTILNNTNLYTGITKLSSGAIGLGIDSVASSPPTIDAGPLGTGTLTIDTAGSSESLFASGGAHVVGNPINYSSNAVGSPLIIKGSYPLTLSGTVDLSGTNRTLQIDNTGGTTLSGTINDDGYVNGITKTGNGPLYLDALNDYTGTTLVSTGLLAGVGSLYGPVVVQSSGTIGAGDAGVIGTLSIDSDLDLSGNVLIKVNKGLAPGQSNDVINVVGLLTNLGTGTIVVTNLGTALAVGDSFTLFNTALLNGGSLMVSGGGVNWNNHLATDGSISVASIIVSQPPSITSVMISGSNLVISGTNGTAGAGYYVLSSTNAALPMASWKHESTNTFGAGGAISATVGISAGVPAKFYRIQLQ